MKIQLIDTNPEMVKSWKDSFSEIEGISIHEGNLFDFPTQAIVSPANSFGFMDGGLDLLISKRFGWDIQRTLQEKIKARPQKELLIGEALIIETGDKELPFVISAPTMRVPEEINNTVNVLLATRSILAICKKEGINTVSISGLGSGTGRVPHSIVAKQMKEAYNNIILDKWNDYPDWRRAKNHHNELMR